MRLSNIIATGFLLVVSLACTSSKWVTSEEMVLDIENATTLESFPVLRVTQSPTPDNPTLELTVYNNRLIQSPLRVESQRVIQKYRPRYGILAAGIISSATLFYISSTDKISDNNRSGAQKNILRLTGAAALIGSAIQMKPHGPPINTGEKKIFGQSDVVIARDSSEIFNEPVMVRLNAAYNGTSLVSGIERAITKNYTFNLIDELRLRTFTPDTLTSFELQIVTKNQVLDLNIPVDQVMNKFVRIKNNSVALRSSPSDQLSNVITTVAESSLLPWVETLQNGWYRVMLGATPAFVKSSNSELVWSASDGSSSDFIVTTASGSYGSVDIEQNIPESEVKNNNAIGIIFTNENYSMDIKSIANAHRSGSLIKDYLIYTLGYREDRIITLNYNAEDEDFSSDIDFNFELNQLNNLTVDNNTDIFFYYNGASELLLNNNLPEFYLTTSSQANNPGINLQAFVNQIHDLNPSSFTMILDSDLSNTPLFNISQANQPFLQAQLLEMIDNFDNSSVIIAANMDQLAGNYTSRDMRTDRVHGILTYYFAQALKEGATNLDQIRDHLRRNVSFTSRRLHDRSQDPIILYNRSYDLLRHTNEE